jgi:adenine-specific DNA-methyltransferase
MGAKVFDFPKPLSLIQGLVAQATRPDQGDIVLDFFAGSGTTAHAVLAQNAEDDGDRRFILVSNAERTEVEPEKNICRDVTRERVRRVIDGYEVRAKKSVKQVEGLGGGFAYLEARRVGYEMAAVRLAPESIWTALQLLHADVFVPFDADAPVQVLHAESGLLAYVPAVTAEAVVRLRELLAQHPSATLYTRRPGQLEDELNPDPDRVSIRKVPDELLKRFGGKGAR